MKILYAVQGTGNGHVSRATQLYPFLKKYGEVDFFISGCNYTLDFPYPIKYKSNGVSLHYSKCGGLDYTTIVKKLKPITVLKEARDLPVQDYDYVINDFECITALACKMKKLPSVQFGHQASFQSKHTPRPKKQDWLGENVLKNFGHATNYIGLHFKSYDQNIFNPVIKVEIQNLQPVDNGHITVYLPSYDQDCILAAFQKLSDIPFHWFLPEVKTPYVEKNIHYFPVNQKLFSESMLSCHGIITGGGFETPAEALYLGKKLLAIPIQKHYEQQCNAAALAELGIMTLDSAGANFYNDVQTWLTSDNSTYKIVPNNIEETLAYLIKTYPSKQDVKNGVLVAD
jgi:uncharacterized protein (TIGR00661 family)